MYLFIIWYANLELCNSAITKIIHNLAFCNKLLKINAYQRCNKQCISHENGHYLKSIHCTFWMQDLNQKISKKFQLVPLNFLFSPEFLMPQYCIHQIKYDTSKLCHINYQLRSRNSGFFKRKYQLNSNLK